MTETTNRTPIRWRALARTAANDFHQPTNRSVALTGTLPLHAESSKYNSGIVIGLAVVLATLEL